MAIKYMFFDHENYDRQYNAQDWSDYFRHIITNGVLNNGDNLKIYADGTSRKVKVTPGVAWINGRFFMSTEEVQLELSEAHGAYDRYDRIVLKLDLRQQERNIKLVVKTGTPGNNKPPALERTSEIYELGLAEVLVEANTSLVPNSNIKDTRDDEELCGIVNINLDYTMFAKSNDVGNIHDSELPSQMRGKTIVEQLKYLSLEGGKVKSVNGKTGDVVLNAGDISETTDRKWFTLQNRQDLRGIKSHNYRIEGSTENNRVMISSRNSSVSSQLSCIIGGDNSNVSGNQSIMIASVDGYNMGNQCAMVCTHKGLVSSDSKKSAIIGGWKQEISGADSGVIIGGENNQVSKRGSVIIASNNVISKGEWTVCGGADKAGGSLEAPSTYNIKWEIDSTTGTMRLADRLENGYDFSDYAEFFESEDGNQIPVGTIVTLVGDKIKPANKGDYLLGVISKTAGVVLNGASLCWHGRYLKDEFGGYVYEKKQYVDEKTGKLVEYYDKKVNPEYVDKDYTPRSERKEWHIVGLIGQIYVRVDDSVKVGDMIQADQGIGVLSDENTRWQVMKITTPYSKEKGYGVAKVFVK